MLSFKPKQREIAKNENLDEDKGDKLLISYIADESVPYTIRKTTAVSVRSSMLPT
ncbi:MAG: hypothetical protein ACM3UY_00800 [Methanocella sp.]